MTDSGALAADAQRYTVVRELGRGGMGSVDLVWDALRGETVAKKRAHVESAEAFVRLRREFRTLAELRHPALVVVHELAEDGRGPFFTMEAIDGVDLWSFCRHADGPAMAAASTVRTVSATEVASTLPSDECPATAASDDASTRARTRGQQLDLERLATVLPWVLEGLSHLHARGFVHRDLKPSNILVEPDGRARIVDFGILAELSAPPSDTAGTPEYMAPEQIRGAPPTPATDLYALGVILFELAAGRPPFDGPPLRLLGQHLQHEPEDLASLAPDAPAALVELVRELMRKDPGARPPLRAVAERLLPPLAARAPVLESVELVADELVGREMLQARLRDELTRTERCAICVVEGPTGVGKSALARWACEDAAARGWAILRGRARPSELLAYNAVDGVADELARALGPIDDDGPLADAATRAALAFPALGRGPTNEIDPVMARAVAFEGFVTLLRSLAERQGAVLVVVDDLQWADADSIAFLEALAQARPEHVRLVATLRDDVPESLGSTWVARTESAQRIPVPPLDPDALATIAERAAGGAIDPQTARSVAEACGGRAYFAEVAGRLAHEHEGELSDPTRALARRLDGMADSTSRTLAALAAAEGWLRTADIAQILGTSVGEVDGIARELADLALVRRTGTPGPQEAIDLYHDAAREAALEALGERGLQRGHASLVEVLESRPDADALRIVRHLIGAGRRTEAATRARREAHTAEGRQAFALAAELYGIAAEGAPRQSPWLLRRRATALIRAGRYREAGDVLGSLEASDHDDHVALAFDRAYARLMEGEIDAGRRGLDALLRLEGAAALPRGFLRSALGLVRSQLGPPRPPPQRGAAPVGVASTERREREAEVALLLTWEEPLIAHAWATRIRALGDAAGRPERGAFADYVTAFMSVAGHPRASEPPLAARYLETARRRATPIRDEPHIAALDGAVQALWAFHGGEFRAAAAHFESLADTLEAAGRARTHTHLLLLSNVCGALLFGERPAELVPALERFEAACPEEQGAMAAHTLILRLTLHAFRGERDAYHELRRAMREQRDSEPRFHHALHDVLGVLGDLHWGDPCVIRPQLAETMRRSRRFRPLGSYFAGALCGMLALVEAAALRAGDRGASTRRIERWARTARRAPPLFVTGAIRASAYAADHGGDRQRALALLTEAESRAEELGHEVSRCIARHQRGRRLGGEQGAALSEQARRDLATVGAGAHLLEEDRV